MAGSSSIALRNTSICRQRWPKCHQQLSIEPEGKRWVKADTQRHGQLQRTHLRSVGDGVALVQLCALVQHLRVVEPLGVRVWAGREGRGWGMG